MSWLDEAFQNPDFSFSSLVPGLLLFSELFTACYDLVCSSVKLSPLSPGLYFLAFLETTEVARGLALDLWNGFAEARLIDKDMILKSIRVWVNDPRSSVG